MTGSDNITALTNSGSGQNGIPLATIPIIVFMVFILVINGCVILLISCSSSLRTKSNIILASLAVSDFLVGLIGIPLLVACSSTVISSICVSSTTFFTFMALSTVLHITVMTCDRYIYIMWALRYREIVNRSRVMIVLGLIWFMSLTSLVRFSWIWDVNVQKGAQDADSMIKKDTIFFLFNTVVFFLIPLIVMIVLDAHMLLLLRRQCQRISKESLPSQCIKHEQKLQKRQRRFVLTCVLLLVLFVILWLPYFILELLQLNHQGQIPHHVVNTIYYLRLCTSIFNPITYTLRKYDLKKQVKSICKETFSCWHERLFKKRLEDIPLSKMEYV